MDKVTMECCIRCDHVYKEVWNSWFAKARAKDAPEMDKSPLGSGRLSLGLKYSQMYHCDVVLKNVYTFTTHAMCYPIIHFVKNIHVNYFCTLDKVRKFCDSEKWQITVYCKHRYLRFWNFPTKIFASFNFVAVRKAAKILLHVLVYNFCWRTSTAKVYWQWKFPGLPHVSTCMQLPNSLIVFFSFFSCSGTAS